MQMSGAKGAIDRGGHDFVKVNDATWEAGTPYVDECGRMRKSRSGTALQGLLDDNS